MACVRLPKASLRLVARSIAFALALGTGLLAPPARADVALVPAFDGSIGAFLLLGPLNHRSMEGKDLSKLRPEWAHRSTSLPATWRLVSDSGAIDLAKKLRTNRKGARAVVAGVLSLSEKLDGLLLLSVDGSFSVSIDGNLIGSRHEPSFRGSSWDTMSVALEAGQHRVILLLEHPGTHWAFEARLLDRRNLRPPRNARWVLHGVSQNVAERLQSQLLRTELTARLDENGYHPHLRAAFPRGAVASADRVVSVRTQSSKTSREFRLGSVSMNSHGMQTFVASLPPILPEDLPRTTSIRRYTIDVGGKRATKTLVLSRNAIETFQRARATQHELGSERERPVEELDIVQATLEYRLLELERASASGQAYLVNLAVRNARQLLDQLTQDTAFFLQPGIHQLAHTSALDGNPQSFWLHVPSGFDPAGANRYPAVLALHGYNGSPKGITEAFLDTKSGQAKAGVNGFVIAPEAHGNAFYRGAGEYEAMAVLRLVQGLFPIDDARISVTGVSMGGTGAAHLALRYSDTFSAAAPLCGYHSYFIRRDTKNHAIEPWELPRMAHWSTSYWADNGRHLPMFVAHGTQDYPLDNSRVLVQAYKTRGFPIQVEWPNIGHAVWTVSYKRARLWPWLSQNARPSSPKHVTLYSDAPRYSKRYWVDVQQFESFGKAASLDAERTGPGDFVINTRNVQRFRLTIDLVGQTHQEASVVIDGQRLKLAPSEELAFVKADRWRKADSAPPLPQKRPGVEGPIRDVFLDRVAFVYGTEDPTTWRINREVAEQFGRYHSGVTLTYPVLADHQVTPKLAESHSLVLVGTPRDHSVLRRLQPSLPIKQTPEAIRVGSDSYTGQDIGAIFIHPNPEHPSRYIVVITGAQVGGVLRALSLPRLLPDFVIFDASLRPAATEQVLGPAAVRAAGYFTRHWQLPVD